MAREASTARRERGGKARRQRAALRAHVAIAGLERKIPTYDLLGEEGLARIEAAADTIFGEVGIEFRGDEAALRLWRDAGADVAGERVRFPVELLRSILNTAPSAFVQHARNPERSLVIGGEHVVFVPAYGSPFVRDLEGGRRYGTLAISRTSRSSPMRSLGCTVPAARSASRSTFPSASAISTWSRRISRSPTSRSWAR